MKTEYKISNGVKVKVTRTEHALTGGRTGKLQNKTLTLTGTLRAEDNSVQSFILTDETGRRWIAEAVAVDGKCKLTGGMLLPLVPGTTTWDVMYSHGIRIISIEKL